MFIPLRLYQDKLKKDVVDVRSFAFSENEELIAIPFGMRFEQPHQMGEFCCFILA